MAGPGRPRKKRKYTKRAKTEITAIGSTLGSELAMKVDSLFADFLPRLAVEIDAVVDVSIDAYHAHEIRELLEAAVLAKDLGNQPLSNHLHGVAHRRGLEIGMISDTAETGAENGAETIRQPTMVAVPTAPTPA